MPIDWPKGKRPVFIGTRNTKAERYGQRMLSSLIHEAATTAIADAGLKPGTSTASQLTTMRPTATRRTPPVRQVDDVHLSQILPAAP